MPAKPARGRSAARVGRRAQIDAEESMAECIAEVDDVTAGLDAEERDAPPAVPATGPSRNSLAAQIRQVKKSRGCGNKGERTDAKKAV